MRTAYGCTMVKKDGCYSSRAAVSVAAITSYCYNYIIVKGGE